MANMKLKTKNQLNINEKPRVYFTCHPDDFEKYFEKVCDDIFKTHDCAIYYTEDMNEVVAEDEKEVDLGRNNLFVVPVTYKLLSKPNRAMDEDIPYALQTHIPVLPIMMESGIDVLYSKPDKFGELQYLNPYSTDFTEIAYEEKLKKYLETVLISDEMAKRVRAAFDAYIFLSYRKKDRKYANELMRIIHSNPDCRDIAIWFDEFLTPGESFRESIDKILSDSKLFALLVTPNLLEEPDGKPNFVMKEEYPAAYKSGKKIVPAEMVETDKDILNEKFKDIPSCIKPDDSKFHAQFLESIARVATDSNNTPEHNFLIGLAYLDGIDVEVNREFALELITSSAEAGLPEAMKKLYKMYNEGIGVALDYRKAVIWAEKHADYMIVEFGEEHHDTLASINNLAYTYDDLGQYKNAFELNEKVYALRCKVLGEEHLDTISSLNNLAVAYYHLGDNQKSFELNEKAYALRCKVLGEEHLDSISSLNNLAVAYYLLGDNQKSFELIEKAYALRCKVLGEKHPDTLTLLGNLADNYNRLGQHKKAFELSEKAYTLRCKVLGEEHPATIVSLNSLARIYEKLGEYKKAFKLSKKAYALRCKVLGEEHPDTIVSLNSLARIYEKLGEYKKAFKLSKKAYALRCKVLGEEHPDTLKSLNNVAFCYKKLGYYISALSLYKKLYDIRVKVLGEEHPITIVSLNSLACIYEKLGEYEKALELNDKAYTLRCKVLGEEHAQTLTSLNNVAFCYKELGEYATALSLYKKLYDIRVKVLGENHDLTIKILGRIDEINKMLGEED